MTEEPRPPAWPQAAVTSLIQFAIQATQIGATIEHAVDLLMEQLSVPVGAVIQWPGPGRAAVVHVRGPVRLVAEETADAGILASPIARGPLAVHGLRPARGSAAEAPEGLDAGLSVSVSVEGLPWGRLLVSDRTPRVFSQAEVETLQIIAAVLGAAVERDRVDSGRAVLADLGRYALASDDLTATMERAVEVLKELVETPLGAVVRHDPDGLEVIGGLWTSGPLGPEAGGGPVVGPDLAESLLGPEPVVIRQRGDEAGSAPGTPPEGGLVAWLAPAIPFDGRTWGRLVAGDSRRRRFNAREVQAASAVANVLAAALRRDHEKRTRVDTASIPAARGRGSMRRTTEVALLDRDAVIVWVNEAWQDFCRDNGGDPARTGIGMSYLACCEAAGDPLADEVADAVRAAIAGDLPAPMAVEIPCHGPRALRWFDLLISSRLDDDGECLGATVTLFPLQR
ncbi:MAG: GAF domain-containing protein [Kineosporiaceae bacterium]